jgi:hypothetical protein
VPIFRISEYPAASLEHPDAVPNPAIVVQPRIDFSDGAVHQSQAFSGGTRAIRISTDTNVCVKVGGINPVATLDDDLLSATQCSEYRWVVPYDRLSILTAVAAAQQNYTAEDGVTVYTAEDGVTPYTTE